MFSPNAHPESPCRAVALLPTYDNARTLAGVIEGVLRTGLPVLVVNDGSADGTAAVVSAFAGRIHVVTHDTNQGKAAALKTGFEWALKNGYTHAVTIDTDGQHDPADAIALVDRARQSPESFVLGTRRTDTAGYPKKSRVGRWAANTLVRWEAGPRVSDSQCGLRVYPLRSTLNLPTRSNRYGYETEVLTRCGWAGVPIVEVPIRCVYAIDGGRVTHFRPWVDSLRAARLHVRLLTLGAWRWLNPMPAIRAARAHVEDRRRLAAAVSAGVFVGNLPLFGLHTAICIVLAKRLKMQPLAVIAGSHISTPPIGPVLIAAAIAIGHFCLHGNFVVRGDLHPAQIGFLECLRRVAMEWTIGGIVLGSALAVLANLLVRFALRLAPATDTAAHESTHAAPPASAHARQTL
jgi:uncharacterized protein (DUF2062 family)